MNVAMQLKTNSNTWMRRLAMPVLAVALVGSFATYECVKPAAARAAAAAPAAAPLDVDSVSALLSLDKAMETLAARVTPAVVNVTVTSRAKAESLGGSKCRKACSSFSGRRGQFGQFFGQRAAHAAAPA